MPIYEYRCRKCGTVFEELVRGREDEDGLACPRCGAGEPERCLSACAVRTGGGEALAPTAPASGGFCGGGGGFS